MEGMQLLYKELEMAKRLECRLLRHVSVGGSSVFKGELRKESKEGLLPFEHLLFNMSVYLCPQQGLW